MDHVIEQLRRWLPVHRQTVGVLILADGLGRALAIDAVGRPRIITKPEQRRLRVVDEIGPGRRRPVIGTSPRILVGLDRAGDHADAGADRRTAAGTLTAADDAADDRAGDAALDTALDHLR